MSSKNTLLFKHTNAAGRTYACGVSLENQPTYEQIQSFAQEIIRGVYEGKFDLALVKENERVALRNQNDLDASSGRLAEEGWHVSIEASA